MNNPMTETIGVEAEDGSFFEVEVPRQPEREFYETGNPLDCLIEVANRHYSGHLTILKFTTNWRVEFKTPSDEGDAFFDAWPVGKTFEEAAAAALVDHEKRAAVRVAKVSASLAALSAELRS